MALTDGNTRGRTAWTNTRTNMTKKTRHTLTWNEPQRAEDSRTKTSNTWWFQWDKTVRLLVRCTHTLTVTHTRMMMSQSRNHDVLFEAINLPGDTRLEEAHSWRRHSEVNQVCLHANKHLCLQSHLHNNEYLWQNAAGFDVMTVKGEISPRYCKSHLLFNHVLFWFWCFFFFTCFSLSSSIRLTLFISLNYIQKKGGNMLLHFWRILLL